VGLNIWKRIRLVSRASLWLAAAAAMAQTPSLTLDKHSFFPDESVRFWIGVSATEDIPEALWSSGVVHTVGPDGTAVDQRVSRPPDGDSRRGFKGGWGLGPGPHRLGAYRVSFEFAGKKTGEQILEIVPNPFAGGVEAYWTFESHRAVLRVENHTARMVRFAEPGLMGSEISITVRQGGSSDSRFVPAEAVSPPLATPAYSFDRLDWSNLARWPMASVPPGQAAERTIALSGSFTFREGEEYDVTLGVALTLFIGESGDREAGLFP